ncbi:branched-chain amino acid transport system II carrier protein, partial [Intestinimonas butyriciproducens]|uniref:branched-chain amino acid transport system II carrier protein n=1 Tax=Intestinimonas butyriciproducens TaxID=1297617 RepID=UPI001AB03EFC
RPVGMSFASILLVLIHLTIGPFAATPRTATVPYEIGFAPYLPAGMQKWWLLIFTGIFFILVFALSITEGNI